MTSSTNVQSPSVMDVPVSQFYYSGVIGDLVIGQASNAVSSGVRRYLPQGTFVVNFAKDKDTGCFFVQVGVSTGDTLDAKASDLWPTWTKDTVVFSVQWITAQVQVPSVYFANLRQSLPTNDVREVLSYVLLNG